MGINVHHGSGAIIQGCGGQICTLEVLRTLSHVIKEGCFGCVIISVEGLRRILSNACRRRRLLDRVLNMSGLAFIFISPRKGVLWDVRRMK